MSTPPAHRLLGRVLVIGIDPTFPHPEESLAVAAADRPGLTGLGWRNAQGTGRHHQGDQSTLAVARPGSSANHWAVLQSFHLPLLGPSGAGWLDGPPDRTCKDSTGQRAVDGCPSCKQRWTSARTHDDEVCGLPGAPEHANQSILRVAQSGLLSRACSATSSTTIRRSWTAAATRPAISVVVCR